MKELVKQELGEHASLARVVAEELVDTIVDAANAVLRALRSGGKVLLVGNGGSAADAEHIAAELVGRFKVEGLGLPAVALTANAAVLTALANDYDYTTVFSRQIEALACGNDVLIAISTSGTSPSIVEAATVAREKGMAVIGLTGGDGGRLRAIADPCVIVPSADAPRVQEMHITIGHIVCGLVKSEMAPGTIAPE